MIEYGLATLIGDFHKEHQMCIRDRLVRVAKRPIFILKLKPFIVLVSISLPTQSVPNR